MLEPIVVDAPMFYPHGCAQCGSQTGPLVDTSRELAGGLRVYLCASCIRIDAIKLDLVDGDESDLRRTAVVRANQLETQLETANERIGRQDQLLKQAASRVEAVQAEAAQAHGRVAQLEEAIAAEGRSLSELVAG